MGPVGLFHVYHSGFGCGKCTGTNAGSAVAGRGWRLVGILANRAVIGDGRGQSVGFATSIPVGTLQLSQCQQLVDLRGYGAYVSSIFDGFGVSLSEWLLPIA